MTILSRQNIDLFYFWGTAIIATLACLCLLSPRAYGQASLQPSTSSLQPQTGQAQQTNNLNQTGAVQNNPGGQSFLNQSSLRPLGVVSSPNQNTPEAVITTATTAPAIGPSDNKSSVLPYIAGSSLAIVILGTIWLWRAPRKEETPEQTAYTQEAAVLPAEPVKRAKKDKKSRRKRRKTNQR